MCTAPTIPKLPPAPAPPPTLDQLAPKSASTPRSKRGGLSRYKIKAPTASPSLGGIPKKTGV